MKPNRIFLLLSVVTLPVISSITYHQLHSKIGLNNWGQKCLSRELASLKNTKFNIKEYVLINKNLEQLDLEIESKNKDEKFFQEKTSEITKIKDQIKKEREETLEKSRKQELKIVELENELNLKPHLPEVEKTSTQNLSPLSEDKKKELIEKIAALKKDKEIFATQLSESNLLIENAENLLERISSKLVKKVAPAVDEKKETVKDEKKETTTKDANITTLQEQLCDKERKIAELEKEVEENIKDKEEIAKIISRKNKKEDSQIEINSKSDQISNAYMQMMAQMSYVMQNVQMQKMQIMQLMNNAFHRPYSVGMNENYSYGNYYNDQFSHKLGQGFFGMNPNMNGPSNAPVTNNYFYGQNPFINSSSIPFAPYSGGFGGQGMGQNGMGQGGTPTIFPNYNRGIGNTSFFNFSSIPTSI